MNEKITKIDIEEILNNTKNLIPWIEASEEENITAYTKKFSTNFLRRFYLFSLTELTFSNEVDDIPKFINEKYLNVLAAAYKAKLTVLTAISGSKGKIQIHLGCLADENQDYDALPKIFQKIIEGVFPGAVTQQIRNERFEEFLLKNQYTGIVSGIPTLKVDDEKQRFNVSSIVRSMHDENYTLVMISRPVGQSEVRYQFQELLNFQDLCHQYAHQTINKGLGKGEVKIEQSQSSEPSKKTRGWGINLILLHWNWGETEVPNDNKKTTGQQWNWSENESVSFEQKNGIVLELEKIAGQFIERLRKGLNVGYWETTITFSTETKTGRDILGGSFIGELSRPSSDNFPAKLIFSDPEQDKIVLLPSEDSVSNIFPKSLCSYLTSEELSLIASPPTESLPGYEIKRMPPLSLSDLTSSSKEGSFQIGKIADYGKPLETSTFGLSDDELVKHSFIAGITGSGKTTTVKQILKQSNVPFLVLESAKRDYRQLLGDDTFEDKLRIYTIGDATISPIQLNPFYILPLVSPLSHIDSLKAIFNASFSLYGPMPHILEKCLHNIYTKRGWNLTKGTHPFFLNEKQELDEERYQEREHYYCFPTLDDLKNEVDSYVKNYLDYKGELSDNIRTAIVTRLESLGVGAKGLMFNTYEMVNLEELLSHPTIFEMESLSDDDDKAFFMGLMLAFISEFRQINNPTVKPYDVKDDRPIKHLLIIEEAHRLLKNVETERTTEMMGNPKGKAVDCFSNLIAEMRSLGEGVVVVEQIPTKIAPDVIKNTNTKIIHRLVSKDDQSLLAGSLSITDEDALYINRLRTGFALCHKEGMERPIEVKITRNVNEFPINHDKVRRTMLKRDKKSLNSNLELNEFKQVVGLQGKVIVLQLLNSLLTSETEHLKNLLVTASERLNHICLKNNYSNYFSEETRLDYSVHQILEIFTTEKFYRNNWKYPRGLAQSLKLVLREQKEAELDNLKESLANYWSKNDTKEAIYEIVSCMVRPYFKKQVEKSELDKIISGHFLLSLESAEIDNISDQIAI